MKTKQCCRYNCFNEAIGYYKVTSGGLWLCKKHKEGDLLKTIYKIRGNPEYSYLHDMETEYIGSHQICHYSNHYKTFVDEFGKEKANVLHNKALKFIELERLDYNPETKVFFVKPITGYNKTIYTLKPIGNGQFCCDCQGYTSKEKKGETPFCSHLLALFYAFKMGYFKGEKL